MAIINTVLGQNSFQFDYSTGTSVTEIFVALNAEIVNGHGWEVYDAQAGANKVCYRAKNKDDVTYKYVVLDLNTEGSLELYGYEAWDNVTHTGTNLVEMPAYSGYPKLTFGAITTTQPGQLYLFINPRWLGLVTRNPFDGSLNQGFRGIFGCFEFSRDNAEDTGAAGLPCFCMLNTASMFSPVFTHCANSPRLKNGAVGTNAKLEMATILGKTDAGYKFTDFIPTSKNPWNNKDWALTVYVHEPNFCVRGRLYGLKISTLNAYLILDRIIAKCDTDYLYEAEGQDTEHHIVHCTSANAGQIGSGHNNLSISVGRVIIPV